MKNSENTICNKDKLLSFSSKICLLNLVNDLSSCSLTGTFGEMLKFKIYQGNILFYGRSDVFLYLFFDRILWPENKTILHIQNKFNHILFYRFNHNIHEWYCRLMIIVRKEGR